MTRGMTSLLATLLTESVDFDSEYFRALESGDEERAKALVKKAAFSRGYRIGPVYHGGASGFNEFSFDHLGKTGTSNGAGFYFTTNEQIAGQYRQPGGTVLSVFLALNKPLSDMKKTMTVAQLEQVIGLIDPSGEDYMSNFGDIHHEGRDSILRKAAESSLKYCQTDAEVMSSMIHSGVEIADLYRAVETITGRTGIIQRKPNWGHDLGGHTIYLATEANQIKLSDAITRDDSGQIIPPSRRFDSSKSDMRY